MLLPKRHINHAELHDDLLKYNKSKQNKTVILDDKVDEYIQWNFENMIKGKYSNLGEYWLPIELKNFIEKMAVWYEITYPDYVIKRIMLDAKQNKNFDIETLKYNKIYDISSFMESLSWKEKYRLENETYKDIIYIDENTFACLYLSSKGFVERAENFDKYTNNKIKNIKLKGMHVKDVLILLKDNEIALPINNELETVVDNADKWIKQKEGLLDAVMYRIIERGGNRIGARRGFIFAKEFGRNIDIPMMYSVDFSDPYLRLFMNEYLKAGGSKDLVCYVGYFSRTSKYEKLPTITVQELINKLPNDAATFYTLEEDNLHQKLADVLANQVKLNKVKQLKK